MFALVDCNNFYASCQRVFRPDLNGKPIVVLSNNDGCVIARSNEAKAVGIPMGAPAFKNQKLFKKHQVHVFSANFPLYGDMSNRVMSVLSTFTPDMEIYSIDEAFLKFSGFDHFDLKAHCDRLRKTVTKSTGIPISVGVAPTKALSKLANLIAKKFPERTGGVYIIDSEEKRLKALKWTKIEDVWGIGWRNAKRLKLKSINTAYDFIQLDDQWVRKNLTVIGLRLKHDLAGKPTLDLEDVGDKQSIATTRSFEHDYTEYEQVKERISTFACSCAEKLRQQKTHCNALVVFIRTNRHGKKMAQYRQSFFIQLPYPTHSSIVLSKFAEKALRFIFKQGYHYKRAGVIALDFTPENSKQLVLFSEDDSRHVPLMKAIDQMNLMFGQQKIRLGSQDQNRVWKMRQEKLSPNYTTKLSDIITVNV